MRVTETNNVFTVRLEGRIDTNNAAQTEKEIFDSVGEKIGDIIIDAENLEYISSAGLRVLMKIRKIINKPLPVINVSRDVYDIFETTGFTELFDVKKALRVVSVDGCEEIGSGGYGTVYRLDAENIIKVYNHGTPELIESERLMSQRAFVNGLPTAIPYDMVKVGDKYGVIYEMLEEKTVAQLITADPSGLEEYVRQYASALRKFHTVEISDKLFKDKKTAFYEMTDMIRKFLSDNEYSRLNEYLDSIPSRRTFIHGDYNLKNVMIKNGEVMLIDIGDAGIGHPVFDLAGVWLFCLYTPKIPWTPEEIKRLMGIEPALGGKVWDIFCKEYFMTDDTAYYTNIIKPMELFTHTYHAIRRSIGQGDEVLKARVDTMVRGMLLPAIQETAKIDF